VNARRSGFTLVEMLVVIAVLSTVLTTIGLTMHTLFMSSQRMRDMLFHRQQIERFVWQLREDTHQASAVAVKKRDQNNVAATNLELTCPASRTIQYILTNEQIDRVERRGTQLEHQESYAVVARLDTGWQIETQGESPLVKIQLVPGTGLAPRRRPDLDAINVAAAVNIAHSNAAFPQSGGDGS